MIETVQQKTLVGTRVATVGRDGTRCCKWGPIWTGKVYEAQPRKSDGVLVWILVDTFGGDRSGKYGPSKKYCAEVMADAESMGLEFVSSVCQYNICE
jgi:hypothetical protein